MSVPRAITILTLAISAWAALILIAIVLTSTVQLLGVTQ